MGSSYLWKVMHVGDRAMGGAGRVFVGFYHVLSVVSLGLNESLFIVFRVLSISYIMNYSTRFVK